MNAIARQNALLGRPSITQDEHTELIAIAAEVEIWALPLSRNGHLGLEVHPNGEGPSEYWERAEALAALGCAAYHHDDPAFPPETCPRCQCHFAEGEAVRTLLWSDDDDVENGPTGAEPSEVLAHVACDPAALRELADERRAYRLYQFHRGTRDY